MKIIKDSSELMVVKDSNHIFYLGGILFVVVGITSLYSNSDWYIGAGAILIGLLIILILKHTEINLDKNSGHVQIVRKSLIHRDETKLAFDQIQAVELVETYENSSRGKDIRSTLYLVLNDSRKVPLNLGSGGITFLGKRFSTEASTGQRISAFLGVPFEEHRPPTVREILETIQSR